MRHTKILLLIALLAIIGLFFLFELHHYFDLSYFKSRQAIIDRFYQSHPFLSAVLFFCLYAVLTGLSLPGAALLSLVGGAIFGLFWGALLVSFASTLGATLAFLMARYLLRNSIQKRFSKPINAINRGIQADGLFYLFSLRMVPIFPFFIINLVMGLTGMRLWHFIWISQLGMLAGTLVYVNAGTQLAQIQNLSDILSARLLLAFVLLGIFPFISKRILTFIKHKRHAATETQS